MKLISHLIFTRHDHHLMAGLDNLIEEFAQDLCGRVSSELGEEVVFTITVPSFSEYRLSDYRFLPEVMAPRLWLDLYYEDTLLTSDALDEELKGERGKHGGGKTERLWKFFTSIVEHLSISVLSANISSPGVISCIGGGFLAEDRFIMSAPTLSNYLLETLELARELGWPREEPVSYATSRMWTEQVMKGGDLIAQNESQRALAAFSNIAARGRREDSGLEIFWAIMGLEALYCKGTEGLKKQLFEKASVLFGEIEDNKKKIRRMYDVRSSYVHGSLNMPYSFTRDSENEESEYFYKTVSEAESTSFLLLVATLQYLVSINSPHLEFEYKLKN